MPLAGLPHANKYDRKDSPAEKEMRVRTREHVRNEGSRRFKSAPLRQRVFSFRDSLITCAKSAHLAGIRQPSSTGETISSGSNASFGDFSLFALWAVDLACRLPGADLLLTGACSGRLRKSEGSPLRRRPTAISKRPRHSACGRERLFHDGVATLPLLVTQVGGYEICQAKASVGWDRVRTIATRS